MVSPTLETGRGIVGYATPDASATATVVTPTDRVRWGPIFAGLACALAVLSLLSVLGLAVGFTAYDADDRLKSFGIGAGIWAAISALIAFFVGGMISARTSAMTGKDNGLLQGAMVWVVAVPLLAYMMAGLVGNAARATNAMANTAAQAGTVATQTNTGQEATAQTPTAEQAKAKADELANKAKAAATPENAERASSAMSKAAWGTLLSLILGLAAAAVGGMVGARTYHLRRNVVAA